jgi:hypothetical protein
VGEDNEKEHCWTGASGRREKNSLSCEPRPIILDGINLPEKVVQSFKLSAFLIYP